MQVNKGDIREILPLVRRLWPNHEEKELVEITASYIEGKETAVFASYQENQAIGVALCSLRHDYVEGCSTSPVGYLEGIYVQEEKRRRTIAYQLFLECEAWAKEKGCREFASDCELDNTESLNFHLGIGFTEENRIICFNKVL